MSRSLLWRSLRCSYQLNVDVATKETSNKNYHHVLQWVRPLQSWFQIQHQQGKHNTLPWRQGWQVIMTFCLQTSRWSWKSSAVPRAYVFVFTWINLRNHKLSQVFQTQIGGKFAALIDREIDTIANDIKVGLLQLKRYLVDMEKIQILLMNETLDVCVEKRDLKGWNIQMVKQGEVPTLHNEVRKKMRSTKDNWIDERCDIMVKGCAKKYKVPCNCCVAVVSCTTPCACRGHYYQDWFIHSLDIHQCAIHVHFWCHIVLHYWL